MSTEEILRMYISKVDQDQAALHQDQAALRSEMRDLRDSIDRRMDRLEDKMSRMEGDIQAIRTDTRKELKEQRHFYVTTLIASLGVAVTILALLR